MKAIILDNIILGSRQPGPTCLNVGSICWSVPSADEKFP